MNRSFTQFRTWLSVLLTLVLVSLVVTPAAAATGSDPLFSAAGEVTTASDDPAIIRSRLVRVNFDAIDEVINPFRDDVDSGKRLTLNLFDDAVFNAVVDQIALNPNGSYTWVAHLEMVPHSQVYLVFNNGILAGKISTPMTSFQVRYVSGDTHAIVQFDPTQFPDESRPLEAPHPLPEPLLDTAAPLAADDGKLLDVMVLYTEAASTEAGGDSAMENEIALAVAEANQVYANSGIAQRIDLVHTAKTTGYIEAGNIYTDLTRLTNTSDGYLDVAHSLRDTYHADLVSLVVQAGGCGIAWVGSALPGSHAFSVYSRNCMITNLTLPHEMGHNMSARHDWYMDATLGDSYYRKGYIDTTVHWRTVMAYNDHCAALGFNCVRIPYFSNPDVDYNGNPTGVPIGTSTSCTVGNASNPSCDADNRIALNNTAMTMDSFRNSENRWQGNSTAWNTTSNWSLGYVPRTIDDIVIPAAPSGGNFPTINADATVREIIVEAGATLTLNGGTLSVYGNWENHGVVNVTGGTIHLKGILDKTITSGGYAFNHLTLGDGISTQKVTLNDDLDVNGDLSIEANAALYGGSHTLNIAGDWTDAGTTYVPESSTVIFDGSTQTADRIYTTRTLLTQDFSTYDGIPSGSYTSSPPTGWTRSPESTLGWYFGWTSGRELQGAYAMRWWDGASSSVDAWLFSPAVSLEALKTYQVQFAYRTRLSSDDQDLYVRLGTFTAPASMTQTIWAGPGVTNINWITVTQTFQVSADGTYYLGFNNYDTDNLSYGIHLDNITLIANEGLEFYNLTIIGGGATFADKVWVKNNLAIDTGGVMNLGGNTLTVDSTLNNNGTISQTQNIPSGSTTEFLRITNSAGTATKYYGVDITPSGTGLGLTTVGVKGNQTACTTQGSDALLTRCYAITPGSAQNATLRFWYTEAERNGQTANALKLWHYNGPPSQWSLAGDTYQYSESGTTCTSGSGQACWFQAANVATYSPFGVGSGGQPTTVGPIALNTQKHSQLTYLLLGLVLFGLGFSLHKKR